MIARRLDARTSAVKEAKEEAGIFGKTSAGRIGRFVYTKWGGIIRVTVFLMRVDKELKTWAEMDRQRKWFRVGKAKRMVDEKSLRKLIGKVPHIVMSKSVKLKKVDGYTP